MYPNNTQEKNYIDYIEIGEVYYNLIENNILTCKEVFFLFKCDHKFLHGKVVSQEERKTRKSIKDKIRQYI